MPWNDWTFGQWMVAAILVMLFIFGLVGSLIAHNSSEMGGAAGFMLLIALGYGLSRS